VARAVADYREILDEVDALILALPHHLHAEIGEEVLKSGKHVFMEKPLANSVAECERLARAEQSSEATLVVGQVRRFMVAYQTMKEWLDSEIIGEVIGFEMEEGGIYNWPIASDFFFDPKMSGGGVLMDTGAHVLDALLWWMGDLEVVEYWDDNHEGVEADCFLRLKTESGVEGTVTLSRIRQLKNSCVIKGARADMEVSLLSNQVKFIPRSANSVLCGEFFSERENEKNQPTIELFKKQITEWLKHIQGEPASVVGAAEAGKTVGLIEQAYAMRQQAHEEPWAALPFGTANTAAHGQ